MKTEHTQTADNNRQVGDEGRHELPLPEKLMVETFGQGCVAIFPAKVNELGTPLAIDKDGLIRSLIEIKHWDKKDQEFNESLCNELVKSYNAYPKLLESNKELQRILQEVLYMVGFQYGQMATYKEAQQILNNSKSI